MFLRYCLLYLASSYAIAATLYDEIALTSGGSAVHFKEYSSVRVYEKYRSLSPAIELNWKKYIYNNIGLSIDSNGSYDMEIDSHYEINNGARSYKAHGITLDGHLMMLFPLIKKWDLEAGIGAGAGTFWIKSERRPNADYNSYPHGYLPTAQLIKKYSLNKNFRGELMGRVSRLDFEKYNTMLKGYAFFIEHSFLFNESKNLSHGIKVGYSHWIFDKPLFDITSNSKLSRFTIGYEFRLR